jgi:hypothetical protein
MRRGLRRHDIDGAARRHPSWLRTGQRMVNGACWAAVRPRRSQVSAHDFAGAQRFSAPLVAGIDAKKSVANRLGEVGLPQIAPIY